MEDRAIELLEDGDEQSGEVDEPSESADQLNVIDEE